MEPDIVSLCDLLAKTASPQTISDLTVSVVRRILTGGDDLSVRLHPLGFFWIQLSEKAAARTLRLHLWPEDLTIQSSDFLIHDHTFSFTSFILHGEIRNEEYEVMPASQGQKQLFGVEYDNVSSLLKPSGTQINCRLIRSTVFKRGSFYSLPADRYHATAVPDRQFAATLVLTTSNGAKTAHVVGPADSRQAYRCERREIERRDAEGYLERLLVTAGG